MPEELQQKDIADLRKRLKPKDKLHDVIRQLVRDSFKLSRDKVNQRYDKWRQSENLHLAYVDESEVDKEGKKINPFTRGIIVPYTNAIMHTRTSYFFTVIGGRNPIIPMEGVGPNDIIPAKFLEIINDTQIEDTSALAVLYCWLQDADRYGLGVVKNLFHEIRENRYLMRKQKFAAFGVQLFERKIKEMKRVLTYEGNIGSNISPFSFYSDPNVNVSHLQDGGFAGHKFLRSYNYLLNQSRDQIYFNIVELGNLLKSSKVDNFTDTDQDSNKDESNLSRIHGVQNTSSNTINSKDKGFINLEQLYITLIPNDYDLAKRKSPEDWLITLANNEMVIQCEPSIYDHFPFYVLEPNHDYASPFNMGTPEMLKGLNDTLSWLFNSHYENVRKIINDTLVVDPSLIEMRDLLRGGPAKIVRMKERAYGLGMIDKAVKQLAVSDITARHIGDAKSVIDLMQIVSSTPNNLMGVVEEVKRTATESSSTINLSVARLKTIAKIYVTLGINPWWKDMTFNNQHLLSEEKYYKITENLAEELGQDREVIKDRILIKPEDLYGILRFKFPNLDLPIDKVSMAKVWKETLAEVASNAELMNEFALVPIFVQIAWNMGITNISDFRRKKTELPKPRVLPDEQVANEARKGNIVPANQAINSEKLIKQIQERFGAELSGPSKQNGIPSVGERMMSEGL